MLLTLPSIAPEVPGVHDFGKHGERHLRMALAMSRAGMIADSDLASLRKSRFTSHTLLQLIESNWLREVASSFDFKVISAHATLVIPGQSQSGCYDEYVSEEQGLMCGVVINANQPESISIGKTMEVMEAARRGLGCKAVDILDAALSWFCIPFSPGGAFQMAQMIYWDGENDEQEVLARYKEEGEGDVDVVKRAELFAGIPDWAFDHTLKRPKVLSNEAFAQAAKKMKRKPIGPLLSCLDRLNDLMAVDKRDLRCDSPDEFQCTEPMVMLNWSDDDNLGRVFDDFWQFEMQGEQAPYMGVVKFALTDEDLSNALVRIRHTGNLLKALDDCLVALVAHKEEA